MVNIKINFLILRCGPISLYVAQQVYTINFFKMIFFFLYLIGLKPELIENLNLSYPLFFKYYFCGEN